MEGAGTMTRRRTGRPSGLRALLLFLAGSIAAALAGPSPAGADIPSPGTAPVRAAVRFEWGPLEGRIARPVTASADDTWETIAARETASVAWAPTIRALNGGGETPNTAGSTWVPPKALAFGAKEPFFAAFLDSAKHGRTTDVSRTGFQRLDPARASHDVFGEVTLALLAIHGPEEAAAAAALPRRRASVTLRDRPGGERIVELGRAVDSVPEGEAVRRVERTWRCDSVSSDGPAVSFTLAREARFDAQGALLSGSGETPGVLFDFAPLGAVLVLALLAFFVVRRRLRRSR